MHILMNMIVLSDKDNTNLLTKHPDLNDFCNHLNWISISDIEVSELCASLPSTINDCREDRA